MNVRDLIDRVDRDGDLYKKLVDVSGWLVLIDRWLYLLDENLSEPYSETKKIRISDQFLIFAVRAAIVFPLGGGKSFVFHRARIVGVLENKPFLQIKVRDLFMEDEKNNKKLVRVDIGDDVIKRARDKYGDGMLQPDLIQSDDWLDYI